MAGLEEWLPPISKQIGTETGLQVTQDFLLKLTAER